MTDKDTYKELVIPKGGAKAFAEALTKMNDMNAPTRKKTGAKKKAPAPKKKTVK